MKTDRAYLSTSENLEVAQAVRPLLRQIIGCYRHNTQDRIVAQQE
jgi:hypothetical protein